MSDIQRYTIEPYSDFAKCDPNGKWVKWADLPERPVCGTTADGVEVRVGDRVYRSTPTHIEEGFAQIKGDVGGKTWWADDVGRYYSTPDAAEKAYAEDRRQFQQWQKQQEAKR